MTFQEFTARMTEAVSERYGADMKISVQKIDKNNGTELTGMMIRPASEERSSPVVPVMYLEEYYKKAEEGVPIHQLARLLSENYESARQTSQRMDATELLSYGAARKRLFCRMVASEGNEARLSQMPHEAWQDLAITYYVDISIGQHDMGMVQVTDAMMDRWGVNEVTVRKDAWNNTLEKRPLMIRPLGSALAEMSGMEESEALDSPLYLLSNSEAVNGAVCAAYPMLAEEAAAAFDGSFYMLPSSVHEFLLLPDNGTYDAKGLEYLVNEINRSQVADDEVLSGHVYYYDDKTKEFSLASEHEKQMQESYEKDHSVPEAFPALGL